MSDCPSCDRCPFFLTRLAVSLNMFHEACVEKKSIISGTSSMWWRCFASLPIGCCLNLQPVVRKGDDRKTHSLCRTIDPFLDHHQCGGAELLTCPLEFPSVAVVLMSEPALHGAYFLQADAIGIP